VLAAKLCCQTIVCRDGEAGLSQKYSERFCLQHCFGIHSTILGKFPNQLQTVTVRRVTVRLVTFSCFSVCQHGTIRFSSGRIFITFSYWGLLIKYVDGIHFWVQNITYIYDNISVNYSSIGKALRKVLEKITRQS